MTTFIAFVALAAAAGSPEGSGLEKAFHERGVAGFLSAVQELEQKQGPEQTAKTLVGLVSGHDRELEAAAAHALGRMGKAGKAVLPELAKALRSSDFPARLLNELGPGDIPLWLAELLLRPDDPSFEDAAFALGTRFDLRGEKRLLPLLIRVVDDSDADAEAWLRHWDTYICPRLWGVRALGNMQDTAAPSRSLLVDILKREPPADFTPTEVGLWNYERGAAACALGKIGTEPEKTVQLLRGMLNHPDQDIRDWSALGLALLERKEDRARAAKTLAGLLTGRDGEVEAAAAHALGRMGNAGKAVLPELVKGLRESSTHPEHWDMYDLGDIPLWLAEALLRPGDPSSYDAGEVLAWGCDLRNEKRLLPLLIQGAHHANPDVREWGVRALGEMEETAASARPLLVNILKEEPPGDLAPSDVTRWNEVRGAAAFALGQIGAEPESTIRLLTEMLANPDKEIWASSAYGLGRMGGRAAPAIPALVDALANDYKTSYPGPFPKHPAAAGLRNIGEPAIPGLVRALQSEQPVVRRHAAEALFWMTKNKAALGALIKAATEDEDQKVRLVATAALGSPFGIEKDDAVVLAGLVRIVKDKSPEVRARAARVLGRLKSHTEVASQTLVSLFSDSDAKVRRAALRALLSLRSERDITPAVERLLDDPDESVRTSAKRLLDRLQEDDKK